MGQWKLLIKFKPCFGILVDIEREFDTNIAVTIYLPFIAIYIGLLDSASGCNVFGRIW